jgi:glycosyltransferase involved in cell wall biosynthesis
MAVPCQRVGVYTMPVPSRRSLVNGAQRTLVALLEHLSGLGVRVTVHCRREPLVHDEFELFPGVVVRPELSFDRGMHRPYEVAPFHLAEVVATLGRSVEEHDVFYLQDSNRFDFSRTATPVVASINDLVYVESVASALTFSGDRLIVLSDYQAACMRHMLRRARSPAEETLAVIEQGFSADEFQPRDASRMRAAMGLPDDAVALLYPHRPDPSKGLVEALRALHGLERLVPSETYARVRLLVPLVPGARAPAGTRRGALGTLPQEALDLAGELGVAHKLVQHPWVPASRMAEYYSLGAATLCLGSFVEAFGNVQVETALSGTPAIVSRVGAQRTILPDELTRKVDFGDAEAAAGHLAEVIERGERSAPELREHVRRRYGVHDMLAAYTEALLTCRRAPRRPAPRPPEPPPESLRLTIPPWCARLRGGYYNDYAGYCGEPALLACLDCVERGCTAADLVAAGHADAATVRRWLRDGMVASR